MPPPLNHPRPTRRHTDKLPCPTPPTRSNNRSSSRSTKSRRRSTRARSPAGLRAGAGPWSGSPRLVFYGLPWLTWNGRQALLFNLDTRQFYVFGLVLQPQDFIYLAALLVLSALALFFFTALAGRLWCGYTCPQTVYTEIFLWVERRLEGDRSARMRLDAQPWGSNKFARKGGKQAGLAVHRPVHRLHLCRLFHAHSRPGHPGAGAQRRTLGHLLDRLLRLRHLRQRGLTCASRCANTCAPTRASRAR